LGWLTWRLSLIADEPIADSQGFRLREGRFGGQAGIRHQAFRGSMFLFHHFSSRPELLRHETKRERDRNGCPFQTSTWAMDLIGIMPSPPLPLPVGSNAKLVAHLRKKARAEIVNIEDWAHLSF
jgi:hypothetical protein